MSIICYNVMHMDDAPEIAELMTFAAVVEGGSISHAARALGVPRPTVSRRLARLEEKLGVRLLRRTTRTMVLTDAGEVLYAHARVVLAAVRDAVESVQEREDVVRGLVRVSVPPMSGPDLGALVSSFLANYPDVRLEIEATTRQVALVAEGYDLAIRASSTQEPGLIARNVARTRLVAVASPEYLQTAGTPSKPADLSKHRCLVGFSRGEHPATEWPRLRGRPIRIDPVLASNDMGLLRATALAGRGIALVPLILVFEELRDGSLVAVLPKSIGAETRVDIVYPERELVPPAVRAFIDAAIAWARSDAALSPQLPAR